MVIKVKCPNCGEIVVIHHGRLFHHRPKRGKDEIRDNKKRKSFKKKRKESAKTKG